MQELVWLSSLFLMGLVAAAFVFVALNAGPRDPDYTALQAKAYRLRNRMFWSSVGVLGPIMLLTLVPYTSPAAVRAMDDVQVVEVSGQMWSWQLSDATVAAGRPVAFRVTSADVNHGLAIYDPDMRIVAQVQAMPEYTNVLHHTFEREGTYRILCLEYCGTAHHVMATSFDVVSR